MAPNRGLPGAPGGGAAKGPKPRKSAKNGPAHTVRYIFEVRFAVESALIAAAKHPLNVI